MLSGQLVSDGQGMTFVLADGQRLALPEAPRNVAGDRPVVCGQNICESWARKEGALTARVAVVGPAG